MIPKFSLIGKSIRNDKDLSIMKSGAHRRVRWSPKRGKSSNARQGYIACPQLPLKYLDQQNGQKIFLIQSAVMSQRVWLENILRLNQVRRNPFVCCAIPVNYFKPVLNEISVDLSPDGANNLLKTRNENSEHVTQITIRGDKKCPSDRSRKHSNVNCDTTPNK